MAVPIIKVSRKEVERWLAAGTLGVGPLIKDLDDRYYLVACGARFNDRYAKNWVPWVVDTYYRDDEAVYAANALEHESVDLDFTTCPVICYEIWELVDDVVDDSEARRLYEFALTVMGLYPERFIPTVSDTVFYAAWEVVNWYIEQYCSSAYEYDRWYPFSSIAHLQLFMNLKGLDELRAACVAEISMHDKVACNPSYENALAVIYLDDIPF